MRAVLYKVATIAVLTVTALIGTHSVAASAPTVGLQLQAMALEDCPAGCIQVEHPVFITLSPPADGTASRTGAVLIESVRGGDTIQWFNASTGRSQSVTPSSGEPVLVETGSGVVIFTARPGQYLWPGVGALWVP